MAHHNIKRQTVLNRNFILFMAAGTFMAWCGYIFYPDEISLTVTSALFALVLFLVPMIAMPWGYLFDPEGVSAEYLFFSRERYLWKNIYLIHVVDAITDSGRPCLFLYDYKLEGDVEGQHRRYMDGRICKTLGTKQLIEKYWDGEIEGYWHEETQAVKSWWNKRLKKKQKQCKLHLTDEIIPMERNARASARGWLEPFIAEARQYDLEVRTAYVYTTEESQTFRSRPQASHTYTLYVSICPPGETDENRMIVFYVDLIRVRLGKSAYRGVLNPQAEEEVKLYFSDTMAQIRKNGFAACMENN